ncbi:MAG TPA: hypothetical protein VFO66_08140 [Gemmatimonadaceae bacterium]|nr:hypothetical protein [Gemmatimonadaceae bacterium]
MSRDWDREMAKIDKQLASLSDDALRARGDAGQLPAGRGAGPERALPAGSPAAGPAAAPASSGTIGVVLRLLLATAVAVGVVFWPYDARCGLGLAGYLGAVAGVALGGGWSAVWTWRHRWPRAHVIALALVGWGLALAAAEVLPRIGYARVDPARALWVCE